MRTLLLTLATISIAALPAAAQEGDARFFEQKIRPVLVQHCYRCHSAEAKKLKGGLRLDTRAGVLRGGDSGPAIVPGKPAESLLLKALRHEEPAMPPEEKLPDAVIADFERWIRTGAPDPREGTPAAARPAIDLEAGRRFWAFQPPQAGRPPSIDPGWARNDIDRFIFAALRAKGLRPAPDADRAALVRRVTIALTGLPPGSEELDEDFDALVDRLLRSPAFGERWGRHWLDVARYADSNGKDENLTYAEAFRYRDYVFSSFNRDKPFDRFIVEQIAGDLLPADDPDRAAEQLTATGFLVVGPKVLADRDVVKRKMDVVDEQVDTIGKAFLGMTLGCARCHDHKFDPVPATDYYGLAGILASTRTLDGIKENVLISGWMVRALGPDADARLAAWREHEKKATDLADRLKKAKGNEAKLATLREEEARLKAAAPPEPTLVMAVKDEAQPANLRLHVRGDPHHLGDEIPRGVLSVLAGAGRPTMPPSQSGRLELARWLADGRNPLTARVYVNRVWKHLFGEGIVRTVDNFGAQGERPSHPELLDFLAVRFMENGWSTKSLIRDILRSRTYGLSTRADESLVQADPENRLFGRAARRRVDAEVLRDAMLAVSGKLDRRAGASPVAGLGGRVSDIPALLRQQSESSALRSVYLPVLRNELPKLFEVFDFADPDTTTGRRNATTVATQALYLMNNPFVMDQAEEAARRLLARTDGDEARLADLYRRALGRAPSPREAEAARRFLAQFPESAGGRELNPWTALCHSVFSSAEFRFVD
jgi:cytochrome c553